MGSPGQVSRALKIVRQSILLSFPICARILRARDVAFDIPVQLASVAMPSFPLASRYAHVDGIYSSMPRSALPLVVDTLRVSGAFKVGR